MNKGGERKYRKNEDGTPKLIQIIDKAEKKKQFIEALEFNLGHFTNACRSINVNKSSVYDWLKEDDEFKKAVKDVDVQLCEMVESELYKKIKNGDTQAIIFFLKTKGKKRGWAENKNINVKHIKVNIAGFQLPDDTRDNSDELTDFQELT